MKKQTLENVKVELMEANRIYKIIVKQLDTLDKRIFELEKLEKLLSKKEKTLD